MDKSNGWAHPLTELQQEGILQIHLSPTEDYLDRYNELPEVEVADANRKARIKDFDGLMSDIQAYVFDRQVCDFLSLKLLHRHFAVRPNEYVVEWKVPSENGIPMFVARPEDRATTETAYPTTWKKVGGELVPLDFAKSSVREGVAGVVGAISADLKKVSEMIESRGLSSTIGVGVHRGDFRDFLRPDQAWIEETDSENRESIVAVRPNIGSIDPIETSWDFCKDTTVGCSQYCARLCRIWSPGHAIEHHGRHGLIA